MPNSKPTSKVDPTAALRQQRRRDRLKEMQAQKVGVVLNKEQIIRLDVLVTSGYAPDRSSALVKGMEEAFVIRKAFLDASKQKRKST